MVVHPPREERGEIRPRPVRVSVRAMPYDITQCPGVGCPLRERCYRFRAIPVARQDWFGRAPYDPATDRCDHFWDLADLAPTEANVRDRAYALWMREGRPEGRAEAHWHQARAELDREFFSLLSVANLLQSPPPQPTKE